MPFCTRRPNQRRKHSHCVPPKRREVCIDECSRFYPGRDDGWNKKFSVNLFIPTKVSQHWKTFDKTFTPFLWLTVYLRSQKLHSDAKMQNMARKCRDVKVIIEKLRGTFYENLWDWKCFFELKITEVTLHWPFCRLIRWQENPPFVRLPRLGLRDRLIFCEHKSTEVTVIITTVSLNSKGNSQKFFFIFVSLYFHVCIHLVIRQYVMEMTN